MKQLSLVAVLLITPVLPTIEAALSLARAGIPVPIPLWSYSSAIADDAEMSAKEAFDLAMQLNTVEAWRAFLETYPTGYRANLARTYILKLTGEKPQPEEPAVVATPPPLPPAAPTAQPRIAPVVVPPPVAAPNSTMAPASAGARAIARGAPYMGFPERFNRYYTDPAWKPIATVYVSASGSGDGSSRDSAMAVGPALAAAKPGTLIHFLPGKYPGGYEMSKDNSGTYDAPIVLLGERKSDKSIGVVMTCGGERQACINFEGANYIAVDGFEFIGGKFGVRAIGEGFEASAHSQGIAVMNCNGHDQNRDPFFSGQADWAVWERNVASGAGKGDGHGIYLSNGSDWNIVRFNETFSNMSSDFQVNADPNFACKEVGIPFNDARCDAYAGEGEGGQGASDYLLVDGNYFHHGIAQGANFTSVRRSVIRNNIFGLHAEKHNVTFWQETDNPKLGSSDNKIINNLFITTQRHGIKFENHSTRNEFVNNVVIGVTLGGGSATANPGALLMEVDDTVAENIYRQNFYSSGTFEGRKPGNDEIVGGGFSPAWFVKFPGALNHDPNDFTPAASAPFLGKGNFSANAPFDRNGTARAGPVDLGPIEVR